MTAVHQVNAIAASRYCADTRSPCLLVPWHGGFLQVGRLREAIYTQQSDNVQLLCYRSNGTTFWNSISIGPISTTDPSSLGCASSGGSGSLPQQQQQQQQQQQRFFLALHHDVSALVLDQDGFRLRDLALHSCSEGITLVDPNLPEMPIVYVNDAFLEMTG